MWGLILIKKVVSFLTSVSSKKVNPYFYLISEFALVPFFTLWSPLSNEVNVPLLKFKCLPLVNNGLLCLDVRCACVCPTIMAKN